MSLFRTIIKRLLPDTAHTGQPASPPSIRVAVRTMFDIRWGNQRFRDWQVDNPGTTFADFYVEKNLVKIRRGEVQPNLGSTIDPLYIAGARGTLRRLTRFGVRPSHRVIDYGCGSLRVGRRLMQYLEPGNYWGLDVTSAFYELGLEDLDPAVTDRARPRLNVIDDATLDEAAAWQPDAVFSTGMLFHVHPDELAVTVQRLCRLTTPMTQTILKVRVWDGPTLQTSSESWLHPRRHLRRLIREAHCRPQFFPARQIVLPGLGLAVREGWLRITRPAGGPT